MSQDKSKTAEPRGARRKRATRKRLLEAAMGLMAERNMQSVAINEITEAADVGFGSFYNHFSSKEAIYNALVEESLTRVGDAIAAATHTLSDPAEILSTAIRSILNYALEKPTWGQFLIRTALANETMQQGMGRYLLQDLQKGLLEQRFQSNDPLMTYVVVGSTVMGAISLQLNFPNQAAPLLLTNTASNSASNELQAELPERTASTILQILGLPTVEANEIARRALVVLNLEDEA